MGSSPSSSAVSDAREGRESERMWSARARCEGCTTCTNPSERYVNQLTVSARAADARRLCIRGVGGLNARGHSMVAPARGASSDVRRAWRRAKSAASSAMRRLGRTWGWSSSSSSASPGSSTRVVVFGDGDEAGENASRAGTPRGARGGVPPVDARGVTPRRIRPGRDARRERDATRRAALRRPRAARTRIPRTSPEDARATRRRAPPRDPHHGRHRTRPRARRTRTARPRRATRRARHARRRPRPGTTPRDPRGEDADDDARRRRSRRIRGAVSCKTCRRPTRRRHAREPPPRNRPRRLDTRGRTPRPRTRRHLIRA